MTTVIERRPTISEPPPHAANRAGAAVWRFRYGVVCLALTTMAFLQDPGLTATDTKLDLAQNPWGFLGRALHLWDSQGFFGQLQNQAYGYLWPMGPFFGVLRSAGLPPWVVQRLWWSLLLCAAFLGVLLLARLLGVRNPWARLAGALAFALSPRMMTTLGPISSETLPMALAPWVLIPLVRGSVAGSPRRFAALSGIAFACTGGVNAVASVAILPLGVLWLLTRTPGPRRRSLAAWWCAAVALASAWWVVPLFLLGKYSPPFLNWIESASVTTSQATPGTALQGVTDWVAYIASSAGPLWRAGWDLVSMPLLIAATTGLAILGAIGLLMPRVRERAFWALVLAAGVIAVTLGHIGSPEGLGQSSIRVLLDGALAPLRNTHKFGPLIALPIAFGCAWLVQTALQRTRIPGRPRWIAGVAVIAVGLSIVGCAWPLLTGSITRGRSYLEIPTYWREAGFWLEGHAKDGRALVVPGASFGDYFWGRSQDEPLQVLLPTARWAVRDAVPLSSAGNIRFLDEVESRLETGTGSKGLTSALQRAGVRWLVVRNDMNTTAAGTPPASLVHQALAQSPGITLVQSFGPLVNPYSGVDLVVSDGIESTYPAVEIFRVGEAEEVVGSGTRLTDLQVARVFGGTADSLVGLADAALLGNDPVGTPLVADTDATPLPSRLPRIATDSPRRSEVAFGQMRNQYSPTMTPDAPWVQSRPVHDYLPNSSVELVPTAYDGIDGVDASSSRGDPDFLGVRVPGEGPWAAIDGDPATQWRAGNGLAIGQWWRLTFDRSRPVGVVKVTIVGDLRNGSQVPVVRFTTDAGSLVAQAPSDSDVLTVELGQATTRHLTVSLESAKQGASGFGLSDVSIQGLTASRPLTLPQGSAEGGIFFQARRGEREGCVATSDRITCSPFLRRSGEDRAGIDRIIDVTSGGDYVFAVGVRPRPGVALDNLLHSESGATQIAASSVNTTDPAGRAAAAFDVDAATTWVASPLDPEPRLDLRFPRPIRLNGLSLYLAPNAAASRPYRLTVDAGGRETTGFLDDRGWILFPSVVTDRLSIRFSLSVPVYSLVPGVRSPVRLPVGVTEISPLSRTDIFPAGLSSGALVRSRCALGPVLAVDGRTSGLSAIAMTARDVVSGKTTTSVGTCGSLIRLTPGRHRITVPATSEWLIEWVALKPGSTATSASSPVDATLSTNQSAGNVAVSDGDRLLTFTSNFNPGWEATLNDVQLTPIRIDGWRQGFIVPGGASGTLALSFSPERMYRLGLLLGLLALALLIVLVSVPGTRRLGSVGSRRSVTGLAVVSLAAGAMTGGLIGVVAIVLGAVIGLRLRIRSAVLTSLVAGGVVLVTACAFPWPARSDSGPIYAWLMSLPALMVVGAVCGHAARADSDDSSVDLGARSGTN